MILKRTKGESIGVMLGMSEDLKLFLEDLTDFLNGQEASLVKLRVQIGKLLGAQGAIGPRKEPSAPTTAAIPESVFTGLKYEPEQGVRLGDYGVAFKSLNLVQNWLSAFNVLKANSAVIGSPFHLEGYLHRYWLYEKYPEKIFRKKLGEESK